MELTEAAAAFGALSQATGLHLMRLLVADGPSGGRHRKPDERPVVKPLVSSAALQRVPVRIVQRARGRGRGHAMRSWARCRTRSICISPSALIKSGDGMKCAAPRYFDAMPTSRAIDDSKKCRIAEAVCESGCRVEATAYS